MYIIREVFTAKPGQAGKLAKLFKKMADVMPAEGKARVMTDTFGEYNTVIMEMEVPTLTEWEQEMEKYRKGEPDPNMEKLDEETKKQMAGYADMYTHGRREIFRLTED